MAKVKAAAPWATEPDRAPVQAPKPVPSPSPSKPSGRTVRLSIDLAEADYERLRALAVADDRPLRHVARRLLLAAITNSEAG